MSRIDFYILPESGEAARQRFACRLAEKAYRLRHAVHIRTADRQHAQTMDDLLWTFRDGSFVPHEIVTGANAAAAPVTIGFAGSAGGDDLMINLTAGVPDDLAAFPRIAEIVSSDEECRQQGRQRFAEYRDQGHTLETHNI